MRNLKKIDETIQIITSSKSNMNNSCKWLLLRFRFYFYFGKLFIETLFDGFMKIEVRKATLKDLKEIQKLNLLLCKKEHDEYDQTIISDYPFTRTGKKYFKERINKKEGCGFIATVNGKTVGYVIGCVTNAQPWRNISKFGSLDNILVLKEYRDLKIGSLLTKEFFKWCKQKKIKRVTVSVSYQNEKAVNFYKKNGFFDYDIILEKKI